MATPKQLQPWVFKPQERAAAKSAGKTTYFTGRPCKNGHIELRCTASGSCVECAKANEKKSREKKLAVNPDWYKQNYALNPEKYRLSAAKYRSSHPDKVKESNILSMRKRKPQKAAAERARQASKFKATPRWLTDEHLSQIEKVYFAASKTSLLAGFPCHVDHIVPLKGKNVCGLHVPWNLRVVSQSYNSKKKNNLDEGIFFAPSKMDGILVHKSALPWNWSKQNDNRI
jgi:hypothetical protein